MNASLQSPTFDTFVFDLDGTLLDTVEDLRVLTNMALAEEGFPPRTLEEIHSFVGNGVRALLAQAVPTSCEDAAIDRVLAHWMRLFEQYGNSHTVPYAGIPKTVAALRAEGCRLGVLSNKMDAGVQQIMSQCMPGAFDVAHGEGEGFPRKPDPAGLLRTIAELESTPARTVYVGDSPTDVEAAKAAKVFAVAVTWGYRDVDDLAAAQPDLMISRPEELLTLCRRQR